MSDDRNQRLTQRMIQISSTIAIYKPSMIPVTGSYGQAPSQCKSDLKQYLASYTGEDHQEYTSPLDRPPTISYAGPFPDIQSIEHPQSFQGLQRSATNCTVPELSPKYRPVIVPTNSALHCKSSSQNVLPSHTSSPSND